MKLRIINYFSRLNFLGLVFALLFYALSFTPSLLPRTALIQGVVTGFSIAAGYGIGVAISFLFRWSTEWDVPDKYKRPAWYGLYFISAIVVVLFAWLGYLWHDEVRSLVGLEPDHRLGIFTVLLIAIGLALLILTISRSIRRLFRYLFAKLDMVLPRRISMAISFAVVSLFVFWVASGLLADGFVRVANTYYNNRDNSIPAGYEQPTNPLRSGSTDSLSSWETVGFQGRKFVAGGPNKEKIEEVTGDPASDPIRVYVGLKAADTAEKRADLAVKELERTGAFERPVLILATTTGSGWLEPSAVDSIEFIHRGNTAIVSQQYSYLPSWISYLVDKETATEAGQALFDAVYGRWSQMPRETRPKLYAYGLSLGSFGGQTPYSGVNDLRFSIDGALFVGTPNFTTLWRNVTNNRNAGSPEWRPVYRNGETVRFAINNEDIMKDQEKWQYPRILYVQHASDPVVWFDFSLVDKKPDWLSEKRGPDVSPATRWYPVVTFLHLGVDQASAGTVPVGHGHMYGNAVINSWVAITNPSNWSPEKTANLQSYIDQHY